MTELTRYVKNFGGVFQGEEDFKPCYLAEQVDGEMAALRAEIERLKQSRLVAETYLPEIAHMLQFTGYDKVQNTTYLPLTAGWCENLRIAIADLTALRAEVGGLKQDLQARTEDWQLSEKLLHEKTAQLAARTQERNKAESCLARIASLRIDETGTACFSNATDGRGIDPRRVAEQARQTFEQLAEAQGRIKELEQAVVFANQQIQLTASEVATLLQEAKELKPLIDALTTRLKQMEEALNLIINWYDGTPASQGGTLDGLVRIIKHALTPSPEAEEVP